MKVCPNPQCQQPVPEEALFCPACGNSLQTPSEETGESLVGRVLNQKYRLLNQIAEGGMALVYKAEHIFLDDICAVKIIKKGLSSKEEMLKRFQREAKLTRQVSRRSPYIISIYDFGMEDELGFFYVMELLDGYPFTELLLDPKNPPDPVKACRLTCQICEALDVVHEEGLVHRDIKPDNIFLHRDPNRDDEMVKLLDFGIARPTYAKATMLTNYGRVMGTPEYMSPEQCRGPTPQQYERGESHLDGRSDIYSLGVLLYQCLTGDVPFPMPDDGGPMAIHKVMAGHVMEQAEAPKDKRPDLVIPQGLSDAVLKAMAKEPDDRFQTMLEFRDALLGVYTELQGEFKGANITETNEKSQLDTLPIGEGLTPNFPATPNTGIDFVEEPTPAAPAGLVPGINPELDRTAMDVQLPPALLAEANRWAQEHYNNPNPPVATTPSTGGDNVMTMHQAEGGSTPDGLHDWSQTADASQGIETPSGPNLDELAKTVTSPLDPKVMQELRERARQAAIEGEAAAQRNGGGNRSLAPKPADVAPTRPHSSRISGAQKEPLGKKKSPLLWVALLGVPVVVAASILAIHFLLRPLW